MSCLKHISDEGGTHVRGGCVITVIGILRIPTIHFKCNMRLASAMCLKKQPIVQLKHSTVYDVVTMCTELNINLCKEPLNGLLEDYFVVQYVK